MDIVADVDLWHYARSLPPDRQGEFYQAAQSALSRLQCPGDGSIHRALAEILPEYFIPPPDSLAVGPSRKRRPSKLIAGAPIGRQRRAAR